MTDVSGSSREWMADRDDGIRLLDERDFAAATARLTKASAADPTGECAALLGLACYLAEDYAAAAEHYGAAVAQDQQRSDWQQMLAASRANAQAEVNVFVPDLHYFDRDALLAPPVDPALPAPGVARTLARPAEAGSATSSGTPSEVSVGSSSTASSSSSVATTRARCGRTGTASGCTGASSRWRTCARSSTATTSCRPTPRAARSPSCRTGLTAAAGRLALPDRRWQLEQPRQSEGGCGRYPLPEERGQRRDRARGRRATAHPQPPPDQPQAADPRRARWPRCRSSTCSRRRWIQFQNHDWINHGDHLTTELIEVPLADDDPARRAVPAVDDVRRAHATRSDPPGDGRGRRRSRSSTR